MAVQFPSVSLILRDCFVAFELTPKPLKRKFSAVVRLLWWHAFRKRIQRAFIGKWQNFRFYYQTNTDGAASSYYLPFIEYPLYFLITHLVKRSKKPIFFDIGANIGNYTLLAAGEGFEVHSFDPNSDVLRIAKINLLLNELESAVNVNNLALSSKSGSRDFYFQAVHYSGMSSFYPSRSAEKRKVTTTTLDSYCQDHKITHIDSMKIDVEGAEFEVLSGASELLKNQQIDLIFWEAGGEEGLKKQKKTLELLTISGFSHYAFDPEKKQLESWSGQWNCLSLLQTKEKQILSHLKKSW